MAALCPAAWGETDFRRFFSAHVHHRQGIEKYGVRVESLNTIAARDAYNAGKGHWSDRLLTAFRFHRARAARLDRGRDRPERRRARRRMTGIVLGLTGPAGAGKSTVARAVLAALGGGSILHAGFALKAMLRAFYASQGVAPQLVERKVDGDLKRAPCPYLGGRTPTQAQQTLGTEWGRQLVVPDLWLAAWDREARRRLAAGAPAIVNDSIRFENEAAAIRALGGRVIRLAGRRDPRVDPAHVSEAGVLADLTVDNGGELGGTVAAIVTAARPD